MATALFAPDGTVRDIPDDQLQAAIGAGGVRAVKMRDPQGAQRYVPLTSVQDAVRAGGHIDESTETPKEGFWKSLGQDLGGLAKGALPLLAGPPGLAYGGIKQGIQDFQSIKETGKTLAQRAYDERVSSGRAPAYAAAAGVNEAIGVNAKGMEQAADSGDVGGVLGHAAAVPAAMGITAGAARVLPKLGGLPADYETVKTAPQMMTIEDMKQMSPREVSGLEDIYRASAPTGKNSGFRSNLNAALPDLKAVAQDLNLQESKGGIISPDMRTRATVDAINGRLDSIYKDERLAPIQRNAGTPVEMKLSTDARRGLEYLANNAGEAGTQQLASSALKRGTLPIEQADALAQTANKYLKSYEKLPPEQKLQVQATNPKIGGLKELDRALGNSLNDTLISKGEVGLRGYERRYAGLSAVRDALQDRMNAAELDQPGLMKGLIRPIANTLMKGKTGIASASQAAVADIRTGKALQTGFEKLRSGRSPSGMR